MPQENISIIIDAVNRASKELQKVSGDLQKLNAQAGASQKGMASFGQSLKNVGRQMRRTGLVMTATITAPLILLGRTAFKTAQEFEQSMANAFSVMGDIADETKDKLTEFARVLGKKTAFRASEAADAMYKLASAGLDAQKIMGALPGVLDLAAATQSNLADAAEQTSIAMKVFGIASADAAKITDTFVAGIANSNLNFERIRGSMKFAGSAMAGFGKTVEETIAALAVFSDVGIFGFQAGSGLRRLLSELADPTEDLSSIMGKLGVEMEKINPAAHTLGEVFDELQKSGINTTEAFKAFGLRTAPIVVAVLKRANDEGMLASDLFGRMEEQFGATGKAALVAGIQLDTLNGEVLKLKSSLEEVFLSFKEDVFGENLKGTVKSIRLFVDKIGELDASTKKNIIGFLALAAAVGPVLLLFGALVAAIGAILAAPVIAALIAAIGALAVGLTKVGINTVIANQEFEQMQKEMDATIEKNEGLVKSLNKLSKVLGEDIPKAVITATQDVIKVETALLNTEKEIEEARKKGHGGTLRRLGKMKEAQEERLKHFQDILDEEVEANLNFNNEILNDTRTLARVLGSVGKTELKRRIKLLEERVGANALVNKVILESETILTNARIAQLDRIVTHVDEVIKPKTLDIILRLRTGAITDVIAEGGKRLTAVLEGKFDVGNAITSIESQLKALTGASGEAAEAIEETINPTPPPPGGGVGGAAKNATKDIERLREELQGMQDDLANLSAEFRSDVLNISNTIRDALGEDLEVADVIISYDSLREGINSVKKEVEDLIETHDKFVQEAQEGLDEYGDKVLEIREQAVGELLETFNRALEDQKKLEEELVDAEGDRRAELEEQSKLNKQIIAEFQALTSGAANYADEIAKADENIALLQTKLQELVAGDAGEDAMRKQQLALEEAQKNRLILIGKQILATEELENIQKAQADEEFKAQLSAIELTALQLAQDQKRLDDLKKIQEAIAGGKVGELNLDELIKQGIDEDALDLAKRAIMEEEEFRAGLEGQMAILGEFKAQEVMLAETTAEELKLIQEDLESNLTLSYDRMIEKLKELKAAADAAFSAAQRAGMGGGGGALPEGKEGGFFARGGYTGAGNINDIAGVVHKKEWVAPAWMVKAFRPMFSSLENMRKNKVKGFAEGGNVGGTKTFNQPVTMHNNISSEMDFDMVGNFLKFQLRGL